MKKILDNVGYLERAMIISFALVYMRILFVERYKGPDVGLHEFLFLFCGWLWSYIYLKASGRSNSMFGYMVAGTHHVASFVAVLVWIQHYFSKDYAASIKYSGFSFLGISLFLLWVLPAIICLSDFIYNSMTNRKNNQA